MSDAKPKKPSAMTTLKMAFSDRQLLAMLLLGIASGLPYAAVGGTLNAWLTTVDVKPVEIALLSWALLAYSFKFLWAAALQGRRTPLGLSIGPRRFFMSVCLFLIVCGLLLLSFSDPPNNLAQIGLISIFIAVFSASFDIVQAAWRIEVARDDAHLDILSSVEQLGYRLASFLGGFVALILAEKIGFKLTFIGGAVIMALLSLGIVLAAPSPMEIKSTDQTQSINIVDTITPNLSRSDKSIATVAVLIGWAIGFWLIADFMFSALADPESHSVRTFTREKGPWIVGLTVIWLGIVSGIAVYLNEVREKTTATIEKKSPISNVLDILYNAILFPMIELISRLKWAAILVLIVVLSYRFTDLIWGGFAYPFYMGVNYGALGHSLSEVAFASKLMGVFAIMLGIVLGGIAMLRFGRMPVFFLGAVLAAATNLLFADLALGAKYTDMVLTFLQLDHLFSAFGLDIRMARLTSVIFAENLAVGMASAASVAYLSSIVNKEYAAVQYALLVSLVMLLGVLGRGMIGEIIETKGFAQAFYVCALLGGVAVIASGLEWFRLSRKK